MTFVSYAQNGEDVILWRALRDVENGFYIDVGACDPDELSVTRAFYERGWRGINVEPVQEYFLLCLARRPRDINLNVAVTERSGIARFVKITGTGLSTTVDDVAAIAAARGWEAEALEIPTLSLRDICESANVSDIHFLKVDVEGGERSVLEGADFDRYRPWIVVVEATAPLTTERNEQLWEEMLLRAHYKRAFFDGINMYYVAQEHNDLISALAAPPNALDDFKPVALVKAEILVAELTAESAERGRQLSEARAVQAELKRRCEALAQASQSMQTETEQLRARLLEKETSESRRTIFATRKLAESRRRMTKLEQQVETIEVLEHRCQALEAELEHRCQALGAEYVAVRQQRDQLLSSTSWRLSAPLRKIKTVYQITRRDPRKLLPLLAHNFRGRQRHQIISSSPTFSTDAEPASPSLPASASFPLPTQAAGPGTLEYESLDRAGQVAALIRRDIAQRRIARQMSSY